MSKEKIASQLRLHRRHAQLSVDQVGELVGKNGKTVSGWERGVSMPDTDTFLRLCSIYEIACFDAFLSDMPPDGDNDKRNTPLSDALAAAYDNAPEETQGIVYRILEPYLNPNARRDDPLLDRIAKLERLIAGFDKKNDHPSGGQEGIPDGATGDDALITRLQKAGKRQQKS